MKSRNIKIIAIITVVLFGIFLSANQTNAATTTVVLSNPALTSWTVPGDWNDTRNVIYVIGPGGNGAASGASNGGAGGGGGAMASTTNLSLGGASSVSIVIGAGGSGTATWFYQSTSVRAGAGTNGSGVTAGTGGTVLAGTGSPGGNGGSGGNVNGGSGGGGGGAGGVKGKGAVGANGVATASAGGSGGGGHGGGFAGTAAAASTASNGGNGGNNYLNADGGAGGTGIGGSGSNGGGGAGGKGQNASAGGAFAGGLGSNYADWTVASVNYGAGGGGGGGGGNNRTTSTGNNGGGGGGGVYGGGGGGGGDCTDTGCTGGALGEGGGGLIIIQYDAIALDEPKLYTTRNQTFYVGQSSTTIAPLTISDGGSPGITLTNNIRLEIGSSVPMEWDTTITSLTMSGSASGKVSSTVTYPTNKVMLIDVTTSFASIDTLVVSGAKLRNFSGTYSGTGSILLHNDGDTSGAPYTSLIEMITIKGDIDVKSVVSSSPNFLYRNDLMAHWTFDGKDMYQNIRDSSGNGNHLRFLPQSLGNTSTTTLAGKFGQALNFDGSDDYGLGDTLSSSLQNRGDMTISAWVRLKSTPTNSAAIVTTGRSGDLEADNQLYGLYFTTTSGIDVTVGHEYGAGTNATQAFDTNLALNKWYHLVAVRDSVNLNFKLYINGVQFGATSAYAANPTGGANGQFGLGRYISSTYYLPGDLDDVRMYSRVLTDADVKALYQTGKVVMDQDLTFGLVGYWTMDIADKVMNIADTSGSGAHGYLTGVATTTAAGVIGEYQVLGNGAKIETADNPNLDLDGLLTVSAWVQMNGMPASGQYPNVVGKFTDYTGYGIFCSGDAGTLGIRFMTGKNQGGNYFWQTSSYVPNTSWHHYVGVWDGTYLNLYVDGAIYNSTNSLTPQNPSLNDNGVIMGMHYSENATYGYLNGSIDEARIYNRAMDAAEVSRLYNYTKKTLIRKGVIKK